MVIFSSAKGFHKIPMVFPNHVYDRVTSCRVQFADIVYNQQTQALQSNLTISETENKDAQYELG